MYSYWGRGRGGLIDKASPFLLLFFVLRSSIAYVAVFHSFATWAATFCLSSGVQVRAGYFLCFHNPPNSDMDYRIFYVRTWSFVCVRIHTGVGHTDSESAQRF